MRRDTLPQDSPIDHPRHLMLRTVGRATPNAWLQALRNKRRMIRRPRPALDPLSDSDLKRLHSSPAGLFLPGRTGDRVTLEQVENPRPGSSFGFVGAFSSVQSRAPALDGFLVLGIDARRRAHVRPESVRLFRWNEKLGRFVIVPNSTAGPGGDYIAARIAHRGIYAAIGLHLEPRVA